MQEAQYKECELFRKIRTLISSQANQTGISGDKHPERFPQIHEAALIDANFEVRSLTITVSCVATCKNVGPWSLANLNCRCELQTDNAWTKKKKYTQNKHQPNIRHFSTHISRHVYSNWAFKYVQLCEQFFIRFISQSSTMNEIVKAHFFHVLDWGLPAIYNYTTENWRSAIYSVCFSWTLVQPHRATILYSIGACEYDQPLRQTFFGAYFPRTSKATLRCKSNAWYFSLFELLY